MVPGLAFQGLEDTTQPPQPDMPKKNKRKAEEKEEEKGRDEKAADDDDDEDSRCFDALRGCWEYPAIPPADLKEKHVSLTLVRIEGKKGVGFSMCNNRVIEVFCPGAAEAGVLVGDIIVEVMGKYYDPFQDFGRLLPKKNRPVKLKVVRFVKDDGVKKPKTKETEGEASTSAETKPGGGASAAQPPARQSADRTSTTSAVLLPLFDIIEALAHHVPMEKRETVLVLAQLARENPEQEKKVREHLLRVGGADALRAAVCSLLGSRP